MSPTPGSSAPAASWNPARAWGRATSAPPTRRCATPPPTRRGGAVATLGSRTEGWVGVGRQLQRLLGEPVAGAGVDQSPLRVDGLTGRTETAGALAVGLTGRLHPQVRVQQRLTGGE